MKLSVGILISGSGSNMVQLVKSMDDEHPAFASVVISNNSDALGLKKARDLGVPTEIIDPDFIKKKGSHFETELIKILKDYNVEIICSPSSQDKVCSVLKKMGENPFVIGQVTGSGEVKYSGNFR